MPVRRTRRLILGFSAIVLLAGFAILATFRASESARERRRAELERAELKPPPPAKTVVRRQTLVRNLTYPADLEPFTASDIPAEVTGKVERVFADVGDWVKEGQALAKLESRLAEIAVERARVRRDEAQRLLREMRRLLESRAISPTQYEAQLAVANIEETALEEAQEVLRRHTIRAPFAGVIQSRYLNPGVAIGQNQPAFRLLDMSRLRVVFSVSQSEISALRVGKGMKLRLNANPEREFEFVLTRIAPSADARTRMFRVEGELENEAGLAAGIPATVTFEGRLFENTIFLPTNALWFENGKAYVWKLLGGGDGGGERVEVLVGQEVSGLYPIFGGLEEGDVVLLR